MDIYSLIPNIMGEISHIAKEHKNVKQGYAFRGIDDVYAALHAPLVKYGVSVLPRVLTHQREERQTNAGGNLIYTFLLVEYTFMAQDKSSVSVTVPGEGMDSGDKSANKAMSAAFKTAMFQVFCIPTSESVDSEKDSFEVKPRPQDVKAPMAFAPPMTNVAPIKKPAGVSNVVMPARATEKQIKMIWAKTLHDLALDEPSAKAWLQFMSGKEHTKDWTQDDIKILLKRIDEQKNKQSSETNTWGTDIDPHLR